MAINSINTNLASYSAQGNINRASDKAGASIARLSSGNRIVKASDDVAALSVGTVLRTSVSTLKQALLNTNQGSSLLQVADGALSQVVDILQRQKALTVQSSSGQLSDTERSFLNQEFQALSDEINRIAANTKFSSLNLLNGGLSGAKSLVSNVEDSAGVAVATAGAIATIVTPANNDVLNIAGIDITFTTSALGTADAAGKVVIGATATDTARNLVNFLNTSSDARLANYKFVNAAGAVSARWAGGQTFGGNVLAVTAVTGTNFGVGTAANRTIAAVPLANNGLSLDRVSVTGRVTGSLLVNGATAAVNSGQALELQTIEDNKDFAGTFGGSTIGKFTSTYTGVANTAVFSLKVGEVTYTTAATALTAGAAPISVTFTGRDQYGNAQGGTFNLVFRGAGAAFTSQGELDAITTQVNDSLSGITINQNRDITSFQEGEVVTLAGIQVANLDGMQANLKTSNFSNVNIESVKVTAPTNGSSDARIEVVINGETYVSKAGLGNQIGLNTVIALQSTSSNNAFTLVTGNAAIASSATTALDIGTQAKADALGEALERGFGLDGANAKLSFQVGGTAADSLGVKIDSIETSRLYSGQTLSIATQAGATAAGAAVDIALNTVTAIRASVGALQSRFDFAAANVQTSIQNQDAARGALLDTDVTAESTAYATAQVQLQAGIAVLAQANQLPQNLLKLIS